MDRWTDGQMYGGDYNIPFAFFKKRGDDNMFKPNTLAKKH